MTQKLSDAMSKLNTGENRNSMGLGRPPPSPGAGKRNSGLETSTINRMFPDAAAAIAKQKAEFTDVVGVAPASNRNSTVGDRSSLAAPTISTPEDSNKRDAPPASPAAAAATAHGPILAAPSLRWSSIAAPSPSERRQQCANYDTKHARGKLGQHAAPFAFVPARWQLGVAT